MSHLLPNTEPKKAEMFNTMCHEFCSREKCMALAKRIKGLDNMKIRDEKEDRASGRTKFIIEDNNQENNIDNEEKSTQTLLKAIDCENSCPILKEVGVKTDCLKVNFSSFKEENVCTSKSSVVRKCDDIMKILCAKTDAESEIPNSNRSGSSTSDVSKDNKNVKCGTIKSLFCVEGPDIECNISQYKIIHSYTPKHDT